MTGELIGAAAVVATLIDLAVQRGERDGLADRHKVDRAWPENALSETERAAVVARLNSPEFVSPDHVEKM